MAVQLRLAETIADAMIAKLQAGLDARVAAINAAATDEVTITAPDPEHFYVGGLPGIPPQACVVVVTELPSGESEAEGVHAWVGVYEMLVYIQDVAVDRSTLARKLWRQARAVTETLWDDEPREALTGSAFHLFPTRRIPGPVFQPEDERTMWTGHIGIVFRCRQFEG